MFPSDVASIGVTLCSLGLFLPRRLLTIVAGLAVSGAYGVFIL